MTTCADSTDVSYVSCSAKVPACSLFTNVPCGAAECLHVQVLAHRVARQWWGACLHARAVVRADVDPERAALRKLPVRASRQRCHTNNTRSPTTHAILLSCRPGVKSPEGVVVSPNVPTHTLKVRILPRKHTASPPSLPLSPPRSLLPPWRLIRSSTTRSSL